MFLPGSGGNQTPSQFPWLTLINPAHESSTHRPQQLRPCLFHADMGSLPLFSLLQTLSQQEAHAITSPKHLEAGSRMEVSQQLILLPGVSTESTGVAVW